MKGSPRGVKYTMRGERMDSTYYAEYAKVPLETCKVRDEGKLCGRMGYEIADLAYMAALHCWCHMEG